MIEEYKILTTPFSMYVGLNWFFCLACAAWIVSLFYLRRYLFVKPSILLLTYSHVFFQWPLAFYSGYFERYLPDPYVFALLIHTYILFGLWVFSFTFDSAAQRTWDRISSLRKEKSQTSPGAMILLGALIVGITFVYLSEVPLSQTGLYAIFCQPELSGIAREKSLKLLESVPLKYAYSLMVSSLAPLFAVMLFFGLRKTIKRRQIVFIFFYAVFISGLGLVVSLTGARIHAVNMLLVMVIAYLFHRGLPFRPGKFILLIALILLLPTFLTILREGKGISVERMIEYVGYIANRTFVIPMNLGSWYIHYTQMEGGFGLAGIPKLASLLGIPAVNAANLIGLKYEGGALSSVSAGAGYLFTYYSYFGLFSLVISFFSVWLLDISLVIYGKISDRFLLPCMAAISLSTLSFISSDYTTVWLTHGFGVILVFCLFLDRGIRVAAALNQFLSGFPFPAEQKKAIPL